MNISNESADLRHLIIKEISEPELSFDEKAKLVYEFNLTPLNYIEIGMILNVSGRSIEKFIKKTCSKSRRIVGSLENILVE